MLISDSKVRSALLRAVSDEKMSRVMARTAKEAKSVADLIVLCGIPHTTAYRYVGQMKRDGLLVVEKIVQRQDGKKQALYRCAFRSATVMFSEGEVEIDAMLNTDERGNALRLFHPSS